MRMQIRPRPFPFGAAIAILAGVMFTACCPDPPPAPEPRAGCPRGVAPSTRAELDACLNGLAFDSTEHASDQQPLTVIESVQGPTSQACPGDASGRLFCRYGPVARIEPAIGAQRYTEADLRQGRIIAKISVTASEKEGYRKYGLMPGQDTYWWVQTDSSGTKGTSVFLTQGPDGRLQPVRRPLQRERYDESYYRRYLMLEYRSKDPETEGLKWWRAIARWIWTLDDEIANAKCGSGSCK